MERIYIVTNPMPLHNNSPAVSLGKFVQVVCNAGYVPTVIGPRLPERLPGVSDNVPLKSFRYVGKGVLKLLSFIFFQISMFFYCLVKVRKGDSVYFWIADKMIGPFLAAKLKGAEINYFLYGKVFGDGEGGMSEKLVRFMMIRASYVCAEALSVMDPWNVPASSKKDEIKLFVPESDIEVIPYENRTNTVAMYCRLSIGKHIDDSIRAFCRFHEKNPEYTLRIIGGGALETDIRSLITELGADDFVKVTGWLDRNEAIRFISDCRVLLFPTDAEGVPGSVLEAMSVGVPALASPVGGILSVITDGVDGKFLSSADAETIEKELAELLMSDKLPSMTCEARTTIMERFSLESAAENFRAVRERHICA